MHIDLSTLNLLLASAIGLQVWLVKMTYETKVALKLLSARVDALTLGLRPSAGTD